MFACICTYTVYVYTCVHIRKYVHTHVSMCVYGCVCVCMYGCIYVCVCQHMQVRTYVRTYIRTCVLDLREQTKYTHMHMAAMYIAPQ